MSQFWLEDRIFVSTQLWKHQLWVTLGKINRFEPLHPRKCDCHEKRAWETSNNRSLMTARRWTLLYRFPERVGDWLATDSGLKEPLPSHVCLLCSVSCWTGAIVLMPNSALVNTVTYILSATPLQFWTTGSALARAAPRSTIQPTSDRWQCLKSAAK